MSRYDTEEEQIDVIKTWWKKNGTWLLSSILVIAVAFSGWRYWSNSQMAQAVNASALFEVLQANLQQGTFGEVSREALKLVQEQPESPYAAAAALMYAKFSFDNGDMDSAKSNLLWVAEHAQDTTLQSLAYLRLARIQADQKAFSDAQATLDAVAKMNLPTAQKSLYDFVTGQIALSQGKTEQAYQSFDSVVKNSDSDKSLQGLAQIQLDDLSQ
ncbi:YfgM family protein [Thiomicrorhabdus aquaedulcis]|uniref:YfgM family protein n=1 Tax=Thiomicrorhabdus aquaedulcis TaxID=2211106 RepID=UPI000FDB2399|nr:tetratricopeptide repeat protein [Thiomicrorhabdus aquaedulcis]